MVIRNLHYDASVTATIHVGSEWVFALSRAELFWCHWCGAQNLVSLIYYRDASPFQTAVRDVTGGHVTSKGTPEWECRMRCIGCEREHLIVANIYAIIRRGGLVGIKMMSHSRWPPFPHAFVAEILQMTGNDVHGLEELERQLRIATSIL